jgi:hypothetical protein
MWPMSAGPAGWSGGVAPETIAVWMTPAARPGGRAPGLAEHNRGLGQCAAVLSPEKIRRIRVYIYHSYLYRLEGLKSLG